MTKLEQLNAKYSIAKKTMEAYQYDEKYAHEMVLEWEKEMKIIEKEIKEVDEKDEERFKKLNESILTIKDFCAETQCKNCMFYTGKQSIYARCSLMNTNPTQWQIKQRGDYCAN